MRPSFEEAHLKAPVTVTVEIRDTFKQLHDEITVFYGREEKGVPISSDHQTIGLLGLLICWLELHGVWTIDIDVDI